MQNKAKKFKSLSIKNTNHHPHYASHHTKTIRNRLKKYESLWNKIKKIKNKKSLCKKMQVIEMQAKKII